MGEGVRKDVMETNSPCNLDDFLCLHRWQPQKQRKALAPTRKETGNVA